MSFVSTSRGIGQAPLPADLAPAVAVTRQGDAIAQEIFELVATAHEVKQPTRAQWAAIQRDIASTDASVRSAAYKLTSRIAEGTPLQTHQRAKNAACLILYTLGGLTLEQIGTAFN